MKKLFFIINPNSGKKRSKNDLLDALVLFSANYQVEVYCTTKSMDCYEMILKRGNEFDVIVISGGDGTLNEAINALIQMNKQIELGYIPTGTMNDFSKNFQLTPSFQETALKIINGRKDVFDVGRCNERYFAYVAAFGAFTNVSYETERNLKQNLGDIAYIIKAMEELPNLHPISIKMKYDGQVYEKQVLMGLIVNGYRVSGMDVIKREENLMKDGHFDLIFVEWTDNVLEWIHYPIGLLNPGLTDKFVKRMKASHIEIEFDETVSWTLDGEKGQEGKSFVIDNIHNALSIFY